MPLLEHIRRFLESLGDKNLRFKRHFHDRIAARPVTEGLVRDCLKKIDRLIKAERQPSRKPEEQKYKLWFKLSNRYSLVVIAVVAGAQLRVVTAWNTERKWHKEKKG